MRRFQKWKAQGADVYIVAVGQVTKDPYVTNEEIEDFNARMKKEVAGAKYADLYSYLKSRDIRQQTELITIMKPHGRFTVI